MMKRMRSAEPFFVRFVADYLIYYRVYKKWNSCYFPQYLQLYRICPDGGDIGVTSGIEIPQNDRPVKKLNQI